MIKKVSKQIEDNSTQKLEIDKVIKNSYDKYYCKSFDYRSSNFKNYEKKNNNYKAFITEISKLHKEKQEENNINVLKGGSRKYEFYSIIPLRNFTDKIFQLKNSHSDNILLKNIEYILIINS